MAPTIDRKSQLTTLNNATIRTITWGAGSVPGEPALILTVAPTYGAVTLCLTDGREFIVYANSFGEVSLAEVLRDPSDPPPPPPSATHRRRRKVSTTEPKEQT